jgi:CheY-like chemotaxis protein
LAGTIKGSSVLFVDDERPIRDLFRRVLTSVGALFDEAADGNQALAKLDERAFDAVVVDIIMPDREGIETIQQIRKRWPSTFIVAISGGGRIGPDEFLDLAAAVGADRTLTKPIRPSNLLSVLAEGLPSRAAA